MRLPVSRSLLLLSLIPLAGCMSPMTQREAQTYAQRSLRDHCSPGAPCRFVKAQHMAPGWLLDFESATTKYGVLVKDNGTTDVSIWKKPS
jgi:hypothetical protein